MWVNEIGFKKLPNLIHPEISINIYEPKVHSSKKSIKIPKLQIKNNIYNQTDFI